MKTLDGGMSVAGLSSEAFHGAELAGIRAYQRTATAMSEGPISRNRRDPTRPAIDPILVDRTARMIPAGIPTIPAAERGVAEDALEQDGLVEPADVQRPVDEERRHIDRCEVARAEQRERNERVRASAHQEREENEADDPDDRWPPMHPDLPTRATDHGSDRTRGRPRRGRRRARRANRNVGSRPCRGTRRRGVASPRARPRAAGR